MAAERSASRIEAIRLALYQVPLRTPAGDAKVFTGRQRILDRVAVLAAEVVTADEIVGFGFSYALRAGGPAMFAYAREVGPLLLGEDAADIERLWDKLVWHGASMGRSGLALQAIAAIDIALWDGKAKRAGLSLSKLFGAHRESVRCYNTSGGYLTTPAEEAVANAQASLARGVGGIKLKVGHPDATIDLTRVARARATLGAGVPIMVDANGQWDRITALRLGRRLEEFDLTWIEEPLDAYDAEGQAILAAALDTPISTGEMLTSAGEHAHLLELGGADILQPDAPRVGGITPFLRVATLADGRGVPLAPHFVMEIHIHLAAAQRLEPWVEHFDWLEPLFNERLILREGRMLVPTAPGLDLTISEEAATWREAEAELR